MSSFTDRLYREWRRSVGGSGVLITTGPRRRPGRLQKANAPRLGNEGRPVHNPTVKGSGHGIPRV